MNDNLKKKEQPELSEEDLLKKMEKEYKHSSNSTMLNALLKAGIIKKNK